MSKLNRDTTTVTLPLIVIDKVLDSILWCDVTPLIVKIRLDLVCSRWFQRISKYISRVFNVRYGGDTTIYYSINRISNIYNVWKDATSIVNNQLTLLSDPFTNLSRNFKLPTKDKHELTRVFSESITDINWNMEASIFTKECVTKIIKEFPLLHDMWSLVEKRGVPINLSIKVLSNIFDVVESIESFKSPCPLFQLTTLDINLWQAFDIENIKESLDYIKISDILMKHPTIHSLSFTFNSYPSFTSDGERNIDPKYLSNTMMVGLDRNGQQQINTTLKTIKFSHIAGLEEVIDFSQFLHQYIGLERIEYCDTKNKFHYGQDSLLAYLQKSNRVWSHLQLQCKLIQTVYTNHLDVVKNNSMVVDLLENIKVRHLQVLPLNSIQFVPSSSIGRPDSSPPVNIPIRFSMNQYIQSMTLLDSTSSQFIFQSLECEHPPHLKHLKLLVENTDKFPKLISSIIHNCKTLESLEFEGIVASVEVPYDWMSWYNPELERVINTVIIRCGTFETARRVSRRLINYTTQPGKVKYPSQISIHVTSYDVKNEFPKLSISHLYTIHSKTNGTQVQHHLFKI